MLSVSPYTTSAADAYPQIADVSRASAPVVNYFRVYFTAKSHHDVTRTMATVSPHLAGFIDTTLGGPPLDYRGIESLFAAYMPTWSPGGISYPTRILGDERSALVAFTDTPKLFGEEIRILAAVDFDGGRIIRWVDYWDGRSVDGQFLARMRAPVNIYPLNFLESAVGEHSSPNLRATASQLQLACSTGDYAAAATLFSYDAIYEDMASRTQILGRPAIERYLHRALPYLPSGLRSRLRHVVGSASGGGFEWIAAPESPVKGGITAVTLDQQSKIVRLTTTYDSSLLSNEDFHKVVLLGPEQ
jgi:hypothetical protein